MSEYEIEDISCKGESNIACKLWKRQTVDLRRNGIEEDFLLSPQYLQCFQSAVACDCTSMQNVQVTSQPLLPTPSSLHVYVDKPDKNITQVITFLSSR